jgi:hypothetical protein
VLLHEMITGDNPFHAANRKAIQQRIMTSKLRFPVFISLEAKSILKKLLTRNVSTRLGSGATGGADVRGHPYFKVNKIDWTAVLAREVTPPFIPTVVTAEDTSNFDERFTSEVVADSPVTPSFIASMGGEQRLKSEKKRGAVAAAAAEAAGKAQAAALAAAADAAAAEALTTEPTPYRPPKTQPSPAVVAAAAATATTPLLNASQLFRQLSDEKAAETPRSVAFALRTLGSNASASAPSLSPSPRVAVGPGANQSILAMMGRIDAQNAASGKGGIMPANALRSSGSQEAFASASRVAASAHHRETMAKAAVAAAHAEETSNAAATAAATTSLKPTDDYARFQSQFEGFSYTRTPQMQGRSGGGVDLNDGVLFDIVANGAASRRTSRAMSRGASIKSLGDADDDVFTMDD